MYNASQIYLMQSLLFIIFERTGSGALLPKITVCGKVGKVNLQTFWLTLQKYKRRLCLDKKLLYKIHSKIRSW